MPGKPSRTKASPARIAALKVGEAVRTRKAFTQEVIARMVDPSALSEEDRAFATRLALGVTGSIGTLDEVIDRCLRTPDDIRPDVRDALRISTYEILFLDKSPHAAVDQGVELVRGVTPKAAGLANAVLRKIVSAKREFPFGDPVADTDALARQNAFPSWMAKMLIADLGRDAAVAFMEASNQPAPVFLAVNALKTDGYQVEAILGENGIEIGRASFPGFPLDGCLRLQDSKALQSKAVKALFDEGKVLVSDAAAQAIAWMALPADMPGSYLEIGSGRGTKTILLQSNAFQKFGAQIPLCILDNHAFKHELALKRAAAYGAEVHGSIVHDATDLTDAFDGRVFDGVFVDAPCSGLGTLRRHPEIRWRLKPRDIRSLAALGAAMLREAARCVSPGGTLTYATCTVTKRENLDVVRGFLESGQGRAFEVVPVAGREFFSPMLAPGSSDAHFAVHMVRKS